jgi:hypothetical protein
MKELVAIQSELKAPKNQVNKFGGYNYRSAEDILEAAKKVLSKYDCFLVVTDDIVMIGERVYVKATATIINSEGVSVSTSAFAREEENKKGMDAAQVTGSASSYARKYALNGLFCIDDTKDPDATNTHGKEEAKQQPEAKHSASKTTEADISAMVLDIMSSNNLKEITAKWNAYKSYENEKQELASAVRARSKELGI